MIQALCQVVVPCRPFLGPVVVEITRKHKGAPTNLHEKNLKIYYRNGSKH